MIKKFNILSVALILLVVSSCSTSKNADYSNMVARMQVDEPIPGVCDNDNVIVVLPLPGSNQVKAQASISDKEIEEILKKTVSFLKDKPDYKDEGMVNLIINCKGELVRCLIDNETKNPSLDEQIVAVFSDLKDWKPGTLKNRAVDTLLLYSFTIDNGIITLN